MAINAIEQNKAGEELGNGQTAGVGCNFKLSDEGSRTLEK